MFYLAKKLHSNEIFEKQNLDYLLKVHNKLIEFKKK